MPPVGRDGERKLDSSKARPAAASKTGGIDIARFVAACAIVGYHSMISAAAVDGPLRVFAFLQTLLFAALPLFFALSGYLHGTSSRSRSKSWIARRVGLLYGLFGVWSAVYLVARFTGLVYARAVPSFIDMAGFGLAWYHLWFLPVLAGCALLTWTFRRLGAPLRVLFVISALLAVAYIVLTCFLGVDDYLLYRTPMVWWVCYVAGYMRANAPRAAQGAGVVKPWRFRLVASALGVTAAAAYVFGGLPWPQSRTLLFAYVFLIAATAFDVVVRSRVPRASVAGLTALPLPIYLSHPAWISVVTKWMGALGQAGVGLVVVWVAALALSIATAVVMTRVGFLRVFLAPHALVEGCVRRARVAWMAPVVKDS